MYMLRNDTLEVSILDPVADRERMGTRYCTGGYIFQVTDDRQGDLLTGPTYPDSFNVFDGQGIPDAFNLSPLRDPTSTDPLALIPGIGVCDLQQNRVQDWCVWQVDARADGIRMTTQHEYLNFRVEIERTVTLCRRTVRSDTCVKNAGRGFVPVRWFPHPFYPHPETDELIKLNLPVRFPENPGYELAPSGFIRRKGWPWKEGFYLPLDHDGATHLVVLQKHPKLGLVSATCSYAPAFFPIWGNPRTFSWEPFLERSLAGNQEFSWRIDYEF